MREPPTPHKSSRLGWPETIVLTFIVVMAAITTGSLLSMWFNYTR